MGIEASLETPLADAVRKIGSQSAFARLIGRDQSTVHEWLRNSKPLPPEHVRKVEAATGISRHVLRPDIYPPEEAAGGPPVPFPNPSRRTDDPAPGTDTSGEHELSLIGTQTVMDDAPKPSRSGTMEPAR